MDTHVRTPQEIFLQPQHLVVPPFQRPYVWDEEEQWAPLWQDVRRLADSRLSDRFSTPTHFLGAVVVQAQDPIPGSLQASNIIDGQQRLTTLQLLMDAAGAVLEGVGADSLAAQLDVLTHNQAIYVAEGSTRLKVRHTNRDRAAFDEVMDADPGVDHAALRHAGSLVARAHAYFVTAVEGWLGDSPELGFAERADALVQVLTRGLQLVAINLSVTENSQEIFETLNARGTPLTAADLIKNFTFQRLEAEGADTKRAYAEDWPFESKFWEAETSVGRYLVSRSSLFFNQWLISKLGEEIGPKSTFTRFKSFVEGSGQKMVDLLPIIKQQAAAYEGWTVSAGDPDRQLTRVELCVYRMNASGLELLKPVLIWLHEPGREWTPDVDQVVATIESWIVRRQLLRLPGADLGRIVAELIRQHRGAPTQELPQRVSRYLTSLNVTSTYWPGDDEVRTALRTELVYRRYRRGRLRILLEATEDDYRRGTNQPQVPRRGYPIEHVLPQKWADHWPVDGLEAEVERSARVHRLGNLTLLTTSLNSKVSNGPWTGKKQALQQHDTLLLNSRLLAAVPSDASWDEAAIDTRTERMVDTLIRVWPVPEGHAGMVIDPQTKTQEWVGIKHLVDAGLLAPGTTLTSRPGQWAQRAATILPDGQLEIGGQTFESPSGAGKAVKGAVTNGWTFWTLDDGRRLIDVRAEFRGEQAQVNRPPFDWSMLHRILEALPEGHWTTYGTLADAVGTSPQPLGNHITSCVQCANAHRVLRQDGTVAENFAWTDPDDRRDPRDMLADEGVAFVNGRADATRELVSVDLAGLVEAEVEA